MPELPEVQTIVDDLNRAAVVGQRITAVGVHWPPTVSGLHPEVFSASLTGRAISAVRRRAKYICMDLVPLGHLIIHLRMSGQIHLTPSQETRTKHQHLILYLDDQRSLRLHDPRKFGRAHLVADADLVLGDLGPEPLSRRFTARHLHSALTARKRQLKPLLLDQRFLAGLGNIYVDEALWEARLHPLVRSDTLDISHSKKLHRAIRKVLRRGLANGGTSLGRGPSNYRSLAESGRNHHYLKVFRRTGEACPRCETPVQRLTVGQRGTHICPACQVNQAL